MAVSRAAGQQGRTKMNFANWAAAAMAVFGMTGAAGAAEYMEKTDFQKSRAFSPAVITQGGRIVWMAGQTATRDEAGNDIAGNFEAQVRTIFSLMDKTLHKAGGSLANLVTMTVFINDPRHGDRFVEIAARHLQGRQLSGERADHGLEFRPPRHADRDPGHRRDRRREKVGWVDARAGGRKPIACRARI
jgi:2-iminobutanoate/2-iminopropanoate deaminase